ncbi:Tetrahydroberberine oxidase [Linum grandiflorum]
MFSNIVFLLLQLLLIPATSTSASDFLHCLRLSQNNPAAGGIIHTPADPNYTKLLQSTIRDPRFNTTQTPKPSIILTPDTLPQIQAAVSCSRKHQLHLRVRSGGHDYEGLSYTSNNNNHNSSGDGRPTFAILDMVNFRNVTVDLPGKTAWVDSGAILGELYYRIAEKSSNLAVPAGVCHTVGVGGHFSGGGFGLLVRKFGLAADNVVDAVLINADGRIVDRKSMGEDLFWAIRGGGGNTFGIVVSWKIRLVDVPDTLTSFSIQRTLDQNAAKLVHRWQSVANKLPRDLIIEVVVRTQNGSNGSSMVVAIFNALFQGRSERLLKLMQSRFPELGIREQDCKEMSWLEAIVFHGGFPSNTSVEVLLNRSISPPVIGSFKYKAKSDYVQNPIPEAALLKIWGKFDEIDVGSSAMVMVPFGGRMDEIAETSIPFPHRTGKLYQIQYLSYWSDDREAEKHIRWIREWYDYVEPYVSKNPRSAYVNYRDLDIGTNGYGEGGSKSYGEAKVWGEKYFGVNFDRLVRVKTVVDLSNVFRNEQSIPPTPNRI